MRILIITSSFPSEQGLSENAGSFVLDYAKELVSRGHDVSVITPQKTEITTIKVHSFKNFSRNSSLTHIPHSTLVGILQLGSVVLSGCIAVEKLYRKEKFDRVFCFWALPSSLLFLPTSYIHRKKMDTWLLGSDIWKARDYPFGRQILRLISRRSDLLLADGLTLAEEAEKTVLRKPQFLPSSRRALSNVENEDSGNHRPFWMYVGRLHENKGVDLLLKAYIELNEEDHDQPDLYIFGTGPLKSLLMSLADKSRFSKKVHFHDSLSDEALPQYMKRADAVVIPSRIESIPLVLGQAARYSKKVLVTNVGDMGTLVTHFRAALVCDPTVESLLDALKKLQETPVFESGKHELAEFLSLKNSVTSYLKLVEV